MKRILICLAAVLMLSAHAAAFYPVGSSQPRVCLASADKGKLQLRWFRSSPALTVPSTGTEKNEKGELQQFTFNVTRRQYLEQRLWIDMAHVEAFDAGGKKIDARELPDMLEKERAVMVASVKPNPEVLKLLKKGTIFLIVPISLDNYGYYGGGA